MNEMVERAAKAAHDKLFADFDRSDWPTTNCSIDANGFRVAARAAIAAMREPTGRMATAGWAAAYDIGGALPSDAGIRAIWQAMIDAALTE